MTNYITVMMIYLYKMAHSTFIVNDIFPPWWDFAMVGICRQAMMVMTMMTVMTTHSDDAVDADDNCSGNRRAEVWRHFGLSV